MTGKELWCQWYDEMEERKAEGEPTTTYEEWFAGYCDYVHETYKGRDHE